MIKDLRGILVVAALACAIASCAKYKDKTADPSIANGFNSTYCNDPEAVNYNDGFPGTPDNSKCFYPTDVFSGTYSFTDVVYYSEDYLAAPNMNRTYDLMLTPLSRTQLAVYGICSNGGFVSFTADRFYKAVGDSTFYIDSVKMPGQIFCNSIKDTITGLVSRTAYNDTLNISFTIVSDTGITFHTGKAIKK